MKLEMKHLLSYVPYDIDIIYQGVTNTREFSDWRKKEPKNLDIFDSEYADWSNSEPERMLGEKKSKLKGIKFFNKYYTIRVGRSFDYGKNESLDTIKLILRPLSDLTKEITHNGETFVPYEKLNLCYSDVCNFLNEDLWIGQWWDYEKVCKLLEWHFDTFGLIENNLAIPK